MEEEKEVIEDLDTSGLSPSDIVKETAVLSMKALMAGMNGGEE